MKHISRLFILMVFVALFSSTASAQDRYLSTSVYSNLGIGQPVDYRSSQGSAMGVSGVALSSRLNGSIANPALWSNTYFTLASGGLFYNVHEATDEFDSAVNSFLGFSHLHIQFPIVRERVGASLSVYPVTRQRFSTFNFQELMPAETGSDTLQYVSINRVNGGLNRMELGVGARVFGNVSVGYAASFTFGAVEDFSEVRIFSQQYNPVNYTDRTSSLGIGNRFGIHASFPSLFGRNDVLLAGATLNLPVQLSGRKERVTTINFSEEVLNSRDEFGSGESRLPMEFAVGLGYAPNRLFLATAEVLIQNWSDFRNFSGDAEDFLKDRVKLGAGFEYAALRRGESGFFNSFLYRGGFSIDTGHLNLENQPIQTLLFTLGLGIPSIASGSSVDINFDYGIRGTTSHELVREEIFAIRMSFNLSEPWFFRRRIQ